MGSLRPARMTRTCARGSLRDNAEIENGGNTWFNLRLTPMWRLSSRHGV